MANTEAEQSRQLESLKTLGNKKLDASELNFLKSQNKLLLDFTDDTGKNLLADIKEANKEQIQKDVRLNELLNGYIVPQEFEKLIDSTLSISSVSSGDRDEYKKIAKFRGKILNTFKNLLSSDKDKIDVKLFVIRILLDIRYKQIQVDSYETAMSKSWYPFDGKCVKMLHKFQKDNQAGIWERSDADCIVGKRTIQQLAAYTGVGVVAWETKVDTKFTVMAEVENKKTYTIKEAFSYIKTLENDKEIDPTTKVNTILQIYNGLSEGDKNKEIPVKTIELMGMKKNATTKMKDFVTTKISVILNMYSMDTTKLDQEKFTALFGKSIEEVEVLQQNNLKKIEFTKKVADMYISYLQKNLSNKKYNRIKPLIDLWLQKLYNLENNLSHDINEDIRRALLLILIPWPTLLGNYGSDDIDEYLSARRNGTMLKKDKAIFDRIEEKDMNVNNIIEAILLWDMSSEESILAMRNTIQENLRKIDKTDGWIIYESWDAITEEMEWYAGTDQSLMNLQIEWKAGESYNTYMQKMNRFFTDIASQNPSEENMNIFNTLYDAFGKWKIYEGEFSWSWYTWLEESKIYIDDEVKKNIESLIGPTWHGFRKKLLEKFIKIETDINSQKESLLKTVQQTRKEKEDEIDAEIVYYQNMLDQYPDDPKKKEWEELKKTFENAKKTIFPVHTNKFSPGENMYSINTALSLQEQYNQPLYKDEQGNEISVNSILNNQKRAMFAHAFENVCVDHGMDKHKNALKILKNKKDKTEQEKLIDRYANIQWKGWYFSDYEVNTLVKVTQEVVIQVVICAISMGIATVAVNVSKAAVSALLKTRWVLNTLRLTNAAAKFGRYSNIASAGFLGIFRTAATVWDVVGWFTVAWTSLVIEWTVFHGVSTVLNNMYQWQNLLTGLNEVQGYVQSIAFFGVLKEVSFLMNWWLVGGQLTKQQKLLLQKMDQGKALTAEEITLLPKKLPQGVEYTQKQLESLTKSKVSLPNNTIKIQPKNFIDQIGSVWTELWSLMLTDEIISIAFNGEVKEFTVEDITHMVGMILGLRLTHKVNLFGGIHKRMNDYVVNGVKRWSKGEIIDVKVGDKRYSEAAKQNPQTINETSGTYGKNATKEQLTTKRDQLNQEITALKNSWVRENDIRIVRREAAVKYIEGKIPEVLVVSNTANVNQTASNTSAERYINGVDKVNTWVPKKIKIRADMPKVTVERNGKYKEILDKYEKLIEQKPEWYEKELEKLDFELAERITIDKNLSAEYASKEQAETSFGSLNKLAEYTGELRIFQNVEGNRCIRKITNQERITETVIAENQKTLATKKEMRDGYYSMISDMARKMEPVERELAEKPAKSVEEKAQDISEYRNEYYEKFAKESHPDLYEQYQKNKNNSEELKRIDTELAERLILDDPNFNKILFDKAGDNSTIEARANKSFKLLNELPKYQNNIRLVEKAMNGEKVFVIELVPEIGKLDALRNMVKASEQFINAKESEILRQQNELAEVVRKNDGFEVASREAPKPDVKVEVKSEKPEVKQEVEVKTKESEVRIEAKEFNVNDVIKLKNDISMLKNELDNVENWTIVAEVQRNRQHVEISRIKKEIKKLEELYNKVPDELKTKADREIENINKQKEQQAEIDKENQKKEEIQNIENKIAAINEEIKKSDFELWLKETVVGTEESIVENAWREARQRLIERKDVLEEKLIEIQWIKTESKLIEPVIQNNVESEINSQKKIEASAWENLNQTVERGMEKAKEMGWEYVVVVKNSEIFVVNKSESFSESVEMRFPDGRVETGPRKNGKLEGNGNREFSNTYKQQTTENWIFENWMLVSGEKTTRANRNEVISEKWYFAPDGTLTQGEYKIERQLETVLGQNKAQEIERELGPRKNGKLDGKWIKEYENTATWEKTKSEWEFKNWELWSGKTTNAKWELVKEMYQWKEVKIDPNLQNSKVKYIDKPLKENFTQQERLQYKNELLSKIQERYPDWYKEVIDQWYKFEYFNELQWGETRATEKTIYINPRMMWTTPPWLKAKGAEIPILATLHEMSHVITEKNLNLELLAEARINDGTYVNFLEIANKKQLLFIELANIYERTKQTFSPHAMSEIYTKAVNKEGISVGEILPVREDMVELHAKYRRWELETFLNERAPQMWVTKEQVNDILKSFEDAFWSKNSASKVNPEVSEVVNWYNQSKEIVKKDVNLENSNEKPLSKEDIQKVTEEIYNNPEYTEFVAGTFFQWDKLETVIREWKEITIDENTKNLYKIPDVGSIEMHLYREKARSIPEYRTKANLITKKFADGEWFGIFYNKKDHRNRDWWVAFFVVIPNSNITMKNAIKNNPEIIINLYKNKNIWLENSNTRNNIEFKSLDRYDISAVK